MDYLYNAFDLFRISFEKIKVFVIDRNFNNSDKRFIDKEFKRFEIKYKAGKLDFDKWIDIELAYEDICEFFNRLEEQRLSEINSRKEAIRRWTEELQRKFNERLKLEQQKGPLWTLLENLKKEEHDGQYDDFLENIKNQILAILPCEYHEIYKEYFEKFLELWNKLYICICQDEKEALLKWNISSNTAFSIGEDELADRFHRLAGSYFLGDFSEFLKISAFFSQLIPESEPYYFLDAHFSLITNYFGFKYEVCQYQQTPVYSFITNSRLINFKMDYLKQFDEEVKNGVRKRNLINNSELKEYIESRIK